MNKQEFLFQLRKGLSGLPENDIEERLSFYAEMIDDRIEDGIPEETAVNEIGSIDELKRQIVSDIPLVKLVKEKITPKKKFRAWETVLLILGSPVWIPVLLALIAVMFSLYVVLWTVIISLWAIFGAIAAGGISCVAAGIFIIVNGKCFTGIALLGIGIFCAGLSIFAFFGCKAITKGILKLTKIIAIAIKNSFVKGEKT